MCHKLVQFSLFPFVLHVPFTMDMKIHDHGHLGTPAPRTVVTSVPLPGSTGSTGHSVPFVLSRSRSAVPSLQRHKSTQHASAKPRNVPSRANDLRPFQPAINCKLFNIAPFLATLHQRPGVLQGTKLSLIQQRNSVYGPKFH